jgi:hypothetical protein
MRWLLLGVLMLQVATCGQKGPLTLPEPGVTRTGGITGGSDLPVAIVRAPDRDREVARTALADAVAR